MKTIRVILKVPFYEHPAGTVFDLLDHTEPSDWPDDERLREKLNFNNTMAYQLPDGGRGFAVSLPLSHTIPCPEHVFADTDTRKGECRVTKAETLHSDADTTENAMPPCGRLREENVSIQLNPVLSSQSLLIQLPPFEEVAEKMVLFDSLHQNMVLEYVLRNYNHNDTQLTWDVSDLNPGFYELRICFPGDWYHAIRMIKFFPFLVEAGKIPPAPEKSWQPIVNKILEKFATITQPTVDLPNEALDLCQEWGEMYNKPTQERMMARHPELSREEADELDTRSREVCSFVYRLCEQLAAEKIPESEIHLATMRKYPWVSAANFSRLKSIGMYYAWK